MLRPPTGLSFVEMAAFATNYATAWWAMHEIARVRPGEAVLVQAAAGGVGTAAVELARTGGCGPIIGTAGGPEKCAAVLEHGADACVDYLRDDFRPVVRDLTDGAGVAYCLESVGGETYDRSLEALAPMGSLVIIGFSSIDADYAKVIPRLHPLSLFHRSISVGGLNIDNLAFQQRADIWDRLVDHAEQHEIRPVGPPRLPVRRHPGGPRPARHPPLDRQGRAHHGPGRPPDPRPAAGLRSALIVTCSTSVTASDQRPARLAAGQSPDRSWWWTSPGCRGAPPATGSRRRARRSP